MKIEKETIQQGYTYKYCKDFEIQKHELCRNCKTFKKRYITASGIMTKSELHATIVLTHKDVSKNVYHENDKYVLLLSNLQPSTKVSDNSKNLPDTVVNCKQLYFCLDVIY